MPDDLGEPSKDALAAAEELRSFGDYILSNRDWRATRGSSEAIAAAARSRASQILTDSAFENTRREQEAPEEPKDFVQELSDLLNRYSIENASGTPDFILAEYLLDILKAYNTAIQKRATWRGEAAYPFIEATFPNAQGPRTVKKSFFGKDRKL